MKMSQSALTVFTSVLLSALLAFAVAKRYGAVENPRTIRSTSFQLIDDSGTVRGELKLVRQSGQSAQPALVLFGEDGNANVFLGTDRSSEGRLMIRSWNKKRLRGIVEVGHLNGGDTDATDDLSGAWGVGVQMVPSVPQKAIAWGFTNSGQRLGQ